MQVRDGAVKQHRLSRRKNPRKSFFPLARVRQMPVAFPPWHKSLSRSSSSFLNYLFRLPSHSPFPSFCSSLVNLSFAGSRLGAGGRAGEVTKRRIN